VSSAKSRAPFAEDHGVLLARFLRLLDDVENVSLAARLG
jgi:hypothetical protein